MGLGAAFREFRFGITDFHLKLTELVLEDGNEFDAAIDDSVFTLVWVQLVKKFGDVACTKHFVDVCKFLWLVFGAWDDIWREKERKNKKKIRVSSVLAELKSSSEWSFSLKQNRVLCA